MKCDEVAELMQLELDSQLDPSQRKALQDHLAECEECDFFYRRLRLIHAGLENLPKVEPPFSVVDSIMQELERIDRQRKRERKLPLFRKKGFLPAAGAVAAAFLLVAVAFAELNGKGQKEFSGSQRDAGPTMEIALSDQQEPAVGDQKAGKDGKNSSEDRSALLSSREVPAKAADSGETSARGEEAGSVDKSGPGGNAGEMMALKKEVKQATKEGTDSVRADGPSTPKEDKDRGEKMVALQKGAARGEERSAADGEGEARKGETGENPEEGQRTEQEEVKEGKGKLLTVGLPEQPSLFKAAEGAKTVPFETRLPSPDQKYLAVYTQTSLQVYRENEIVFQWEPSGQTFSGLVWLDAQTLQVSIDSGTGESTWVVNVENGDILPADSR